MNYSAAQAAGGHGVPCPPPTQHRKNFQNKTQRRSGKNQDLRIKDNAFLQTEKDTRSDSSDETVSSSPESSPKHRTPTPSTNGVGNNHAKVS